MPARKNSVLPWLVQMYKEQPERIVKWSVGRSRRKNKHSERRNNEMRKEMSVRAANKWQKRSVPERKDVEKQMKDTDINEIKTVFPDIPDNISAGIAGILTAM